MLGRYQNVFRSRWKALWWAGGVLTTAYCSIPSSDDSAPAPSASEAAPQAAAVTPDNSWMLGGSAAQTGTDGPAHLG